MLLRKNFENFYAVMIILVLFKLFSCKFSLIFLTRILSVSPNMMHFVRAFLMYVLKAYRLLLWRRFKIMEKLYKSKTFLKMAGGRLCTIKLGDFDHPFNLLLCFSPSTYCCSFSVILIGTF